MILLAGSQTEGGIENSDSGGNTAALVLAAIAILPLFFRSITFYSRKWVAIAIGVVSGILGILMSAAALLGPQMIAWSIYGGLNALRAPGSFNDLAWLFRWAECDGCDAEFSLYGRPFLWVNQLIFGQVSESWAIPIGFALIIALRFALYRLARSSFIGALPLFALASVSSAWLLLLDRANVDSIIFLLPFVAVLIMQRYPKLISWVLLATLIWYLGTWKFYPFALGLILLPVLKLKGGWAVIGGFGVATTAFVASEWNSVGEGLQNNLKNLYIEDFPAFGRIPIVARMGGDSDWTSIWSLQSLLIILLSVIAFAWGVRFATQLGTRDLPKGLLAVAGSVMFLSNILISGFGFAYKGPFLLLAVPLLALGLASKNRFVLYTAIVSMLLIALSIMLSYSILLTSLASILVASLAAGMGVTACLEHVKGVLASRSRQSTAV